MRAASVPVARNSAVEADDVVVDFAAEVAHWQASRLSSALRMLERGCPSQDTLKAFEWAADDVPGIAPKITEHGGRGHAGPEPRLLTHMTWEASEASEVAEAAADKDEGNDTSSKGIVMSQGRHRQRPCQGKRERLRKRAAKAEAAEVEDAVSSEGVLSHRRPCKAKRERLRKRAAKAEAAEVEDAVSSEGVPSHRSTASGGYKHCSSPPVSKPSSWNGSPSSTAHGGEDLARARARAVADSRLPASRALSSVQRSLGHGGVCARLAEGDAGFPQTQSEVALSQPSWSLRPAGSHGSGHVGAYDDGAGPAESEATSTPDTQFMLKQDGLAISGKRRRPWTLRRNLQRNQALGEGDLVAMRVPQLE